MIECVYCERALRGSQRYFCSEACKQAAKYEQSKGLRCKYCKKPTKPRPIPGGYRQDCDRKTCLNTRDLNDRRRTT